METSKAKPWLVPREGCYLISFTASRFPTETIHIETAEGLAAMVENMRYVRTHWCALEVDTVVYTITPIGGGRGRGRV